MSERIEKMMKAYPQKCRELAVMKMQLCSFAGISETEVIDSMYFTGQEEERVQTSGISDKTARIALTYRKRAEQINREWYAYLFEQYTKLKEELEFFEMAVGQLSGYLPGLIHDLVLQRETWETVMERYHISRKMVAKCRHKAIVELEQIYQLRDEQMQAYILE